MKIWFRIKFLEILFDADDDIGCDDRVEGVWWWRQSRRHWQNSSLHQLDPTHPLLRSTAHTALHILQFSAANALYCTSSPPLNTCTTIHCTELLCTALQQTIFVHCAQYFISISLFATEFELHFSFQRNAIVQCDGVHFRQFFQHHLHSFTIWDDLEL